MQLSSNSWYVRWFFWSVYVWVSFRGNEYAEEKIDRLKENGTNICFFFRTILISAPLAVIANVITFVLAIGSLTYLPIRLWGVGWYFGIILIIGICICVYYGYLVFRVKRSESLVNRRLTRSRVSGSDSLAKGESIAPPPTFKDVAVEWLLSQKKKICPTIQFKDRGMVL